MRVLVLYPDGLGTTEEMPDSQIDQGRWLKEKVGGWAEHVTYLKMSLVDGVLTGERASLFVNELGAKEPVLPFNFIATLLYLEASRQNKRIEANDYPALIHGVAVVMPVSS